jgi:hypothetical protein
MQAWQSLTFCMQKMYDQNFQNFYFAFNSYYNYYNNYANVETIYTTLSINSDEYTILYNDP